MGANGNFGTDSSAVLAVGILKRKVNIAVCFYFRVHDAAGKRIPFLLGWQSRFCLLRHVHIATSATSETGQPL